MRRSLYLLSSLCLASFAQNIEAPAGFSPDGKLVLGVSDDQANPKSLNNAVNAVGSLYHFRNISPREYGDIYSQVNNFAINSSNQKRPSFVISQFDDTTASVVKLLGQMQNPAVVNQVFAQIKAFGDALRSNNQTQATVFLEPNVWARILQARFHFGEEAIPNAPGYVYSQILEAPAKVKATSLGLSDPAFAFLNEYQDNVGDLVRAMIHAVRVFFPQGGTYVGIPVNTWAAYAKGCSKKGALQAINDKVRNNPMVTQADEGIHTWEEEDIKIAAYANIHFFRKMFDSSLTGNSALSKPDFFGIQRSPVDAGFTWKLKEMDPLLQKINGPDGRDLIAGGTAASTAVNYPGYGKTVFYWNQSHWDKWLEFSRYFSQGMGKPLVALRMAPGHLGLSNVLFAWEDTFYDWLFSNGNSAGDFCQSADGLTLGGTCGWKPGNIENFKQAGFVGVWLARDGWPDISTHYGEMQQNWYLDGTIPFNMSTWYDEFAKIGLASPASVAGDGGLFVSTFAAANRSLAPIPVSFNESEFRKYSGNCSAPSTPQLGVVELTGSKVIDGKQSGIYETNSVDKVVVPEIVKAQAITTFAKIDGSDTPKLVGGSDAQAAEILGYYNTETAVKLHVNVKYGDVYDPETGLVDDGKLLPLSYRWFIFDLAGQFVNSQIGRIEPSELKNYIIKDTAAGANAGQIDLTGFFNMRSSKGRKIASGAYIWKGYIDEQSAFAKTGRVGLDGTPEMQKITSENQVITKRFGVIRK